MNRRNLLKGLAVAPLAGRMMAGEAMARTQGLGVANLGSQAGLISGGALSSSQGLRFTDFTKWFADHGDARAKEEAQHISAIDPDLMEMRLPLATIHRFQRKRNYEKIVAHRKSWFERQIAERGFMEWWG